MKIARDLLRLVSAGRAGNERRELMRENSVFEERQEE
jgi:hypothetical protein